MPEGNEFTYTGEPIEIGLTEEDAAVWENSQMEGAAVKLELPTVTYEAKEESELTDGKPVARGNYTARISDPVAASLDFTVVKGVQNITTDEELTFTYGDTDKSITAFADFEAEQVSAPSR